MQGLDDLNPQQQQAVRATKGPVLILAGAGSGKTKTLVYRIAYLMTEQQVRPENILAVTFTNKAAKEMKDRVIAMLRSQNIPQDRIPFIGTFHALCVQILRREIAVLGYKPRFVIYDQRDQQSLVKECLWKLGVDPKQFAPQAIHAQISNAKNRLQTPGDVAEAADSPFMKVVGSVYQEYQRRLKDQNAVDFDDLIMLTVILFKRYPEVLAQYQKRFQYIMVDEYQDTNHAQYELVRLLAIAHRNLCVVGDDFQSIYSWRGANMQNILDFEKDYPQCVVVKLEQNYRSTKTIVEAGNAVIRLNKHQTKKKLWTENRAGEKVAVVETSNEQDEADFLIRRMLGIADPVVLQTDPDDVTYVPDEQPAMMLDRVIQQRHGYDSLREKMQSWNTRTAARTTNIRYSDYAVLYRTNAQSRAIEEMLLRYGVPYQIVGGLKFYDRKEIKDVLAYAQSLVNPQDAMSVRRIINIPARSIGDKSWERLYQHSQRAKLSIIDAALAAETISDLTARSVESVKQFGELIQDLATRIASLPPSESLELIARRSGYKEEVLDGTEEGEARWENIQELKTVAQKFDDRMGVDGLQALLEEVALIADIDTMDDERNSVTLMTVHAAKGLEFPHVAVVGMEEGVFPHARSLFEAEEMEEERRLAYVAFTRAKETLQCLYAVQRTMFGVTQVNSPSRFLSDLPAALVARLSSNSMPVIE